ncbi:type 1 glutamine amidotransferase [Candidatus Bipolaricaulota bacterium]|nr:type 1 glutamine amidotransferase [Candidatus Bipolaricaulota bacterium]
MTALTNRRVAFLVEDGYEDLECWYPKIRLEEEEATTVVASRSTGMYESKHGYPIEANYSAKDLEPSTLDGVVIPGGTGSPDKLRRSGEVTDFVKEMDKKKKMVAMICHAGWVPISAGILNGKKATAFEAIKDDLVNSGVNYVDESVVVDDNLISSRHPGDLPEFLRAIIDYLS